MRVRVTWPGGGQNEYDLRDYDALAASGLLPVDATSTSVASAGDVRAEAARRIRELVGARDDVHLATVLSNGSREAIRLLRVKAERAWTEEEAARASQLEAVDMAIEAIRAASNVLEADPPADFAAGLHWPPAPSAPPTS